MDYYSQRLNARVQFPSYLSEVNRTGSSNTIGKRSLRSSFDYRFVCIRKLVSILLKVSVAPPLNWPLSVLQVVSREERAEMTRLFEAYFRATDDQSREALRTMVLWLMSPQDERRHYDFCAIYTKNHGWLVQARVDRSRFILI